MSKCVKYIDIWETAKGVWELCNIFSTFPEVRNDVTVSKKL